LQFLLEERSDILKGGGTNSTPEQEAVKNLQPEFNSVRAQLEKRHAGVG
jgi:hypothetical protein